MSPNPPRLARWLLRLVLLADRYETVAGDLEEMFRLRPLSNASLGPRRAWFARWGGSRWRARWWFWRQTLSLALARLIVAYMGLFAGLALLLAGIGLYGVMAQAVEQRTREIGVRMALGAERRNIFNLVIGRALIIALAGIGLGVALSLLSMRFLDTLLYQVRPNDPATLVVLALVLLGVSVLASYVPARRGTRVDPLTSLRAE